jgi:hypothetical protein
MMIDDELSGVDVAICFVVLFVAIMALALLIVFAIGIVEEHTRKRNMITVSESPVHNMAPLDNKLTSLDHKVKSLDYAVASLKNAAKSLYDCVGGKPTVFLRALAMIHVGCMCCMIFTFVVFQDMLSLVALSQGAMLVVTLHLCSSDKKVWFIKEEAGTQTSTLASPNESMELLSANTVSLDKTTSFDKVALDNAVQLIENKKTLRENPPEELERRMASLEDKVDTLMKHLTVENTVHASNQRASETFTESQPSLEVALERLERACAVMATIQRST